MCGICGIVSPEATEAAVRQAVTAMKAQLSHRGPDASGLWVEGGVGLGHTRLSILDLSAAGAQPMTSKCGRWVVSYNGEIYNHEDLRAELKGASFRGHSDTETMVEAFAAFGFAATLSRLVGMFAIAAWDRQERRLYLARDRAGQKPLFYGFLHKQMVFGSELNVLEALPTRPELDRESLALMLRYNCIPAPATVYEGFRKLPPASFVVLDTAGGRLSEPQIYWSPPTDVCPLNREGVRAEVLRLLRQSVKLRMLSDVPLGAFLSGGIDSSLVVGVMQSLSDNPVRTFTMDFEDQRFSEAAQARAVAHHLGTRHTEMMVTAEQARDLVPALGTHSDEPFGDSSMIPTLLLSQLTRRHVTVALTGDGGDELFGGYHRQIWLPRIFQAVRWLPDFARRRLAQWLASPALKERVLQLISILRVPLRMPDEKWDKLINIIAQGNSLPALYRSSLSHVRFPETLFCDPIRGALSEMDSVPDSLGAFDRVCRADFSFYMPNDVLVKVDRASMRYGLEARSPFLDHRLVEFAFSLSQSHKVKGSKGKILLRELLSEFLPPSLMSQPKMGFAVPLASWLRQGLRPWAEDLLRTRWLRDGGLLRPEPVQALWQDHLQGRDRHHELWNVLMLLSWLEARAGAATGDPPARLLSD
jgi:asparagine synthase (glutamine-hydrolysing)